MLLRTRKVEIASQKIRPFFVKALTILFVIGALASFISAVSLSFPDSYLKSIWRLNPHAREGFNRIGPLAIVLMSVVCVACICAAIGLWGRRRWGYWFAVVMLAVNLVGDLINTISGIEPGAIVGIPIALAILVYLLRKRTREYFRTSE